MEKTRTLLFVCVLLLGCITGILAVQTFRHPPETWSYAIIAPSDTNLEKALDTAGSNGWEVVSARRATTGSGEFTVASYELILKRRSVLP